MYLRYSTLAGNHSSEHTYKVVLMTIVNDTITHVQYKIILIIIEKTPNFKL